MTFYEVVNIEFSILSDNDRAFAVHEEAAAYGGKREKEDGEETTYEIEDYEGSLICHISAHRLVEFISALREADIRFGSLEVYDDAAFSIAETLEIEREDLTDFAIT